MGEIAQLLSQNCKRELSLASLAFVDGHISRPCVRCTDHAIGVRSCNNHSAWNCGMACKSWQRSLNASDWRLAILPIQPRHLLVKEKNVPPMQTPPLKVPEYWMWCFTSDACLLYNLAYSNHCATLRLLGKARNLCGHLERCRMPDFEKSWKKRVPSGSRVKFRSQNRTPKPKNPTNSTKEFSEQFEFTTQWNKGFEANRTRKFSRKFGESLSQKFFGVPFLFRKSPQNGRKHPKNSCLDWEIFFYFRRCIV